MPKIVRGGHTEATSAQAQFENETMGPGISLARLCDGERDNISNSAGVPRQGCGADGSPRSPPFNTLVRKDVRRPSTDWDWTAIAYLAAGVALLVCLGN